MACSSQHNLCAKAYVWLCQKVGSKSAIIYTCGLHVSVQSFIASGYNIAFVDRMMAFFTSKKL